MKRTGWSGVGEKRNADRRCPGAGRFHGRVRQEERVGFFLPVAGPERLRSGPVSFALWRGGRRLEGAPGLS